MSASPRAGTWSRDNVVLFSQLGRLYRVSASGGVPAQLVRPAAAAGETNIDTWPQFLPDGRRFIVSTAAHNGHIFLGDIGSSRRKHLVDSRSRAAMTASGSLLFRRDDALVSQKLDLGQEQVVGEPLTIAQDLNRSSGGILVDVVPGLPNGVVPAPLGEAGEPRDYTQIFLSPDEQWAALAIRDLGSRTHWNLWLLHLKTNVLSRLTFDNTRDADPAWAPGQQTHLRYLSGFSRREHRPDGGGAG